MLEQPTGNNGHPGTTSAEIVIVSFPVNTPNTSFVTECTVNIVNTNTPRPIHVNNPSHLYGTLYPLLLHQHSTLSSLQHILNPIQHLHIIPTHTLLPLHQLLGRHPSASPYLPPPLPEGGRPRRASPSPTRTQMNPSPSPHPYSSPSPWEPRKG